MTQPERLVGGDGHGRHRRGERRQQAVPHRGGDDEAVAEGGEPRAGAEEGGIHPLEADAQVLEAAGAQELGVPRRARDEAVEDPAAVQGAGVEVGVVFELAGEIRLVDVFDPDGNRIQLAQSLDPGT